MTEQGGERQVIQDQAIQVLLMRIAGHLNRKSHRRQQHHNIVAGRPLLRTNIPSESDSHKKTPSGTPDTLFISDDHALSHHEKPNIVRKYLGNVSITAK
jgi:hypothetical protein